MDVDEYQKEGLKEVEIYLFLMIFLSCIVCVAVAWRRMAGRRRSVTSVTYSGGRAGGVGALPLSLIRPTRRIGAYM